MSNVRKQTIVITVLIVLIACAGWFAKTFNDTVKDTTNALSTKTTSTESTNFFADLRMQKENNISSMKQDLNDIISNKETTKTAKEAASTRLMQLMETGNKENTIETLVKERGFDDALCTINDKNVEVCVKVADGITSEQVHQIKDIVVRTTGISPTNIVIKPKQ